jgi:hypothetical protein
VCPGCSFLTDYGPGILFCSSLVRLPTRADFGLLEYVKLF